MIAASSGPSGLYGTPVTKALLCYVCCSYFLFVFPLHHFHHLFYYDQNVFSNSEWKQMALSKLVYLELPDLLFSCLLIYNFRIFERRFGSRKFVSHMLSTAIVSGLLELCVFAVLNQLNISLGSMPVGLYSLIFPFYVSFYCDIPRVAVTHIMHIPVTGKTLNYILGLQMASVNLESLIVVCCAILSGVFWRANFLRVQTLIQVPTAVAKSFHWAVGQFIESSQAADPGPTLPMGATLELQQRERLDKLEQQMMRQAVNASRRNEPVDLANGVGIFGSVLPQSSLHQDNSVEGDNSSRRSNNNSSSTTSEGVSDDQVNRLVEMGFNDSQVRQALRATNNNITQATHFLLQGV